MTGALNIMLKNKPKNKVTENLEELKASPIPAMPGYYINKEGKVYSVICLEPYVDPDGYIRVNVFIDGKKKRPGIHSIIAKTFIEKKSLDQVVVRHLDGNPSNNDLTNLAWGTVLENSKDMIRHQTSLKGEKNPKAILTEEKVRDIKIMLRDGVKQYKIAKKHGVGRSTIGAINCGINWGWVTI